MQAAGAGADGVVLAMVGWPPLASGATNESAPLLGVPSVVGTFQITEVAVPRTEYYLAGVTAQQHGSCFGYASPIPDVRGLLGQSPRNRAFCCFFHLLCVVLTHLFAGGCRRARLRQTHRRQRKKDLNIILLKCTRTQMDRVGTNVSKRHSHTSDLYRD